MKKKSILTSILLGNKAMMIVLILGFCLSLLSPTFFTSRNLLSVLRQVCVSTILALGFTLVLGAGHIDLSVGSQVGLIGVVMVMAMNAGLPIPLAIIVGMLTGVVVGAINASIIYKFKLPAFIVTLAMQQILRGTIYLVTGMVPLLNVPEGFAFLGQGYIFNIPVPVFIMLFMVGIVWVVIHRFRFGRYLLAMGGNAEAARVSGINTKKVLTQVFIAMGLCASVASVVLTARSASAQVSAGINMEMDAIAAVVVGGTSMAGGSVNVIGAFFGSLIVGMVNNGMNLLGMDSAWQTVSKGALILIAVLIDSVSTSMLKNARTNNAIRNLQDASEEESGKAHKA